MIRRPHVVAAVAAAALSLSAPLAASAAPAAHITVVSTAVAAPFQLYSTGGKVYVADGGPGIISRLDGKTLTPLVTGIDGAEGVAVDQSGRIAYTTSDEKTHAATLTVVSPSGKKVVANLAGFEKAHNPDGKIIYGALHPTTCQRNFLRKATQGPARYSGDVNSNPYAVSAFRNGWWLVADAGGNDILKVSPAGKVSLVALLPRQATLITAAIAKAQHAPKCVVGLTYYSNPVPTDLQFGPNGKLYVSLLAGGIAGGAVYTVDIKTGASTFVAGGFVGATNLAVTPRGVIYVANLESGTISRIYGGKVTTVVALKFVLSLTFNKGVLYAGTASPAVLEDSTSAGPGGSIVKITF